MTGVNPSRDSHYSSADSFGPPFTLGRTDQLNGSSNREFFPTEHGFLVKYGSGRYDFYGPSDQGSGQASLLWSRNAGANSLCPPAYSRGIVILASSTTTLVQAVRIEDGETLWSSPGVGEPVRSTVASGSMAFLKGGHHLAAVALESGELRWDYSSSSPGPTDTPPALSNGLLFFLDEGGTLHALVASSGSEVWSAANAGEEGDSQVIASPDLVFVSDWGKITAFETKQGQVRWRQEFPGRPVGPMAYANGCIYTTYPPQGPPSSDLTNTIVALNASTGLPIWESGEDAIYSSPPIAAPPRPFWSVIENLFVADGRVYFFNNSLGRVRILDAATGSLQWNISAPGIQSIALSGHQLVLLYENRIDTYQPVARLYFPEFAAGDGYSVRLTLNNSHNGTLTASIIFRLASGEEIRFPDGQGLSNQASLVLPPFSSSTLVVPEDGQPARTGWVAVDSELPLTGSLVYQYAPGGNIVNEVGVGDSRPTDFANVKITHSSGWSTAIAIAVPGDKEAHLSFQLLDSHGNEVTNNTSNLESQRQLAKFFYELFPPGLTFENFEGTLVIRSDQPLIVTALRTRNGTPVSSFPVGLKR